MQRVSTTVVALVGSDAGSRALAVGAAANVVAVVPDAGPVLDRASAAWARATSTSRTYLVHDADPLLAVGEAWAALYDGTGDRAALAVAVTDVVGRWRMRSLELPDYYLVLDAQGMTATVRHWYLGVLRSFAPTRMIPVADAAAAVERALTHLPSGRWWPDVPDLLHCIDAVVPEIAPAGVDADPGAAGAGGESHGGVPVLG